MRRGLKFKACIFLIAWATIFAHNVIPHCHIDESFSWCNELMHNSRSCSSEGDRTLKLGNEHSDSKVCHFSSFLFHNISPEAFLAYSCRDMNSNPESHGTKIFTDCNHSYISDHLKGSTFLRAPPAV